MVCVGCALQLGQGGRREVISGIELSLWLHLSDYDEAEPPDVDFDDIDFPAVLFFAVDFFAVDFFAVDFFAVDLLAVDLVRPAWFPSLPPDETEPDEVFEGPPASSRATRRSSRSSSRRSARPRAPT